MTLKTINIAVINHSGSGNPGIFFETSICLRQSLRSAGFTSNIYTNEIDTSNYCIVLGAGIHCTPDAFRAIANPEKTIIFNMEQLQSGTQFVNDGYLRLLNDYIVFDYHSNNIDYLQQKFKKINVFEIPIIPSKELIEKRSDKIDIGFESDILFYGSPHPRRQKIINDLSNIGVNVEIVNGAFGQTLAERVLRTRCVLNIHYYETGLFPIARFLQPIISAVPMVCESSIFSRQSDWSKSGIIFSSYDYLAQSCVTLLTDANLQIYTMRKTAHFLNQLDFSSAINKVISFLDKSH